MTTTRDRSATPCLEAVRDAAPIVLAYLPFGLTLGATLAATEVSPSIAWSSSPLLFGGAAQLVAVQLLDSGASVVVVVLAALVVNARLLLYSAALAPHTADWPRAGGGPVPTSWPIRSTPWPPPASTGQAQPLILVTGLATT